VRPTAASIPVPAGRLELVEVEAAATVLAWRLHRQPLGVEVGVLADAVRVEVVDPGEIEAARRTEIDGSPLR
jgi:hypothetical protein